jgi:ribose transport system permease protein
MNNNIKIVSNIQKLNKLKWNIILPYIVLFGVLVIMGILRPETISIYFLGIKSDLLLPLIFIACGQTLVLISGGLDLSVGGVMSVSCCLAAINLGGIFEISILILVIGSLAGFLNGLIISRFRVQPFMVTMASWTMLSGAALGILKTDGGTVSERFTNMLTTRILGVPVSLLIIVLIIIIWNLFQNTSFGYSIFAIGYNEKAAYYNGVNVGKTKIITYTISGFCAAMAGLLYAGFAGTGSPTIGNNNILISIAAAVIGGTSLAGGYGSIPGTIVGIFILKLISDILVFAGVTSYWAPLFQGSLLIISVAIGSISVLLKQKRETNI